MFTEFTVLGFALVFSGGLYVAILVEIDKLNGNW